MILLVNEHVWETVAKLDGMLIKAPRETVIQPSKALRYV
jgi:hypothetical protein